MLCVPERLRRDIGVADLVMPLTYGIAGAQSGFLLRAYKDNPMRVVRRQQGLVINWLLYLAIWCTRVALVGAWVWRSAAGWPCRPSADASACIRSR